MKNKIKQMKLGRQIGKKPSPSNINKSIDSNEIGIIKNKDLIKLKSVPKSPRNIVKPLNSPRVKILNENKKIHAPLTSEPGELESPRRKKIPNDNSNKENVNYNEIQKGKKMKRIDIDSFPGNKMAKMVNYNINVPIKQTEFGQLDLPLPPASGKGFDTSQLPNRLERIDTIVSQHKSILDKLAKYVNTNLFKNSEIIMGYIYDVEKPMNSFVSSYLPKCAKKYSDQNSIFETQINSASKKIQNDTDSVQFYINDQKILVSQFSNTLQAFFDSQDLIKPRDEISRLLDKMDITQNQLENIENTQSSRTLAVQNLKDNIQSLQMEIDEKFDQLYQQIHLAKNNKLKNLYEEINNEIIEKSKVMFDNFQDGFVEFSNQNALNFIELKSNIDEIVKSINSSIEVMQTDIDDAIEKVNSESKDQINELNEAINQNIENSQKNFEVFREETISTIKAIQNQNMKTSDDFAMRIQNEMQHIQKNTSDVHKKFNNFISLVENERNIQNKHINDITDNISKEMDQKIYKSIELDMLLVQKASKDIDDIERRLDEAENSMGNMIKMFNSYSKKIYENLKEAKHDFKKINISTKESLIRIERRVITMQNKYSTKSELFSLEKVIQDTINENFVKVSKIIQSAHSKVLKLKNDKSQKVDGDINTYYQFEIPPNEADNENEYYSDNEDVF